MELKKVKLYGKNKILNASEYELGQSIYTMNESEYISIVKRLENKEE